MKHKIVKLIFIQILYKKIGAPPYSLDIQWECVEIKKYIGSKMR
jgi:hypothetical protein